MRCGRNAPIIFVGVVFGYFWLSIIGSIICGFLFHKAAKFPATLIVGMKNQNNLSKYSTIPKVQIFFITAMMPFFGIISASIKQNIETIEALQQVNIFIKYIVFGDMQYRFLNIIFESMLLEYQANKNNLWLVYFYGYIVSSSPFICISCIMSVKYLPSYSKNVQNRFTYFIISILLYVGTVIAIGDTVANVYNNCYECGKGKERIVISLLGNFPTGYPVAVLIGNLSNIYLMFVIVSIGNRISPKRSKNPCKGF